MHDKIIGKWASHKIWTPLKKRKQFYKICDVLPQSTYAYDQYDKFHCIKELK